MTLKNGGPAFPFGGLSGMDLRDYFAAAALTGLAMRAEGQAAYPGHEIAAEFCYGAADAMLERLNTNKNTP